MLGLIVFIVVYCVVAHAIVFQADDVHDGIVVLEIIAAFGLSVACGRFVNWLACCRVGRATYWNSLEYPVVDFPPPPRGYDDAPQDAPPGPASDS